MRLLICWNCRCYCCHKTSFNFPIQKLCLIFFCTVSHFRPHYKFVHSQGIINLWTFDGRTIFFVVSFQGIRARELVKNVTTKKSNPSQIEQNFNNDKVELELWIQVLCRKIEIVWWIHWIFRAPNDLRMFKQHIRIIK